MKVGRFYFNTGIFKAADVYNNCTPRGLYVRGSNILNTENAIHTTSQFVSLLGNYIEGSVTSEGLSYSKYFANNFFQRD